MTLSQKNLLRLQLILFASVGFVLSLVEHNQNEIVSGCYKILSPAEKKVQTVSIASGGHGGLYSQTAYRFKTEFTSVLNDKEESFEWVVEPVETKGSVDNLKLLLRNDVELAIIQEDVIAEKNKSPFVQRVFEKIYREELVFVCIDPYIAAFSEENEWEFFLKNHSYAIAGEKTGSRVTTERFLRQIGVDLKSKKMTYESIDNALKDLKSHTIDGFFMVTGLPNTVVDAAKLNNSGATIYEVIFPEYCTYASLYMKKKIGSTARKNEGYRKVITDIIEAEGWKESFRKQDIAYQTF